MKSISVLLYSFILLTSFTPHEKGVEVVFNNMSGETFKTLEVRIFGQTFTFNNLKKGKKTQPVLVEKTYRYCYARGITSRDTVICQPIDYVGETLYTAGKITMNLYIVKRKGKGRGLSIR